MEIVLNTGWLFTFPKKIFWIIFIPQKITDCSFKKYLIFVHILNISTVYDENIENI